MSSGADAASEPLRFAREARDRFHEELSAFLRIPSVSAKTEHDADTARAAQWLRDHMRQAGLAAEIVPTDRHPVVLGEWRGAGPDAPTLLVYGHYDVQPPEPLDLWESPPFEPSVRHGRIYARGAADDKGQLFMHVKAIESHLATRGRLPVNVVALAEGEEEIGSPNLLPFVERHAERLRAAAVVVSDSAMFAPGQPSLLCSLRGLAYFEVHASGPAADLHSGAYGGAVRNPANALAALVAGLQKEDGSVAIAGFYDDVTPLELAETRRIRELPFDEDAFAREAGAAALDGGETAYSPLERLWTRPSCDVNGIAAGYAGEGAKTVLPSSAMAKISFRLVPNQTPERVQQLFERHVRDHAPPGVHFRVEALHGARPWRAEPAGEVFEAAARALEASFGARPLLVGEGGTIPIVVELEEILGADTLLMGFALPGANMHAPNEWLAIDCFERGIDALVRFYDEIGAS